MSGNKPAPLPLTPRDIDILYALWSNRYMTAPQIEARFWRATAGGGLGTRKACQRRLRLLHERKLVRRIDQLVHYGHGHKPYLYTLDKLGAQLLIEKKDLDPVTVTLQPKSADENYDFLQHILAATDLRIVFLKACEHAGVQLERWHTEREIKSGGMSDVITLTGPQGAEYRAAVEPDAILWLNRGDKRALFFLEVDRATVTVDPSKWEQRGWRRKVATYLAYFESAAYKQRYDRPAQILTVTTGDKRLANLKATTEQVGGTRRFWFTTFAQASDPQKLLTAPIWTRAGMEELHALLR